MSGRDRVSGIAVAACVVAMLLVARTSGAAEPSDAPTLARLIPTANLLSDGRVLVAGGLGIAPEGPVKVLASADVWDPTIDSFEPTASLGEARYGHTASLLPDGKVLIAGGIGGGDDLASLRSLATAETWDPVTGRFATGAPLAEARAIHSATVLDDGRVLLAGGRRIPASGHQDPLGILATAELWDPATAVSTPVGSLVDARFGHTATRLADGRVLIVGGQDGSGNLGSAELWDPATGTATRVGALADARSGHTATLLRDGRVLVVGGLGTPGELASTELWDPATGAFTATDPLTGTRISHTATLLADGRVLVVGGQRAGQALASAELWDPTSAGFVPTGSLLEARFGHTATLLADGRVLIVGGPSGAGDLASAELWDPLAGTFGPASPRVAVRSGGRT